MGEENACPDEFFESDYVFKLTKRNFKEFLWRKDLVLVMFYSTCNPDSYSLRKYVRAAASNVNRPRTAFAGVNCVEEVDLCYMEKVKTPMFKLYSGSEPVGCIREIQNVNTEYLKNYVESAPDRTAASR